MIYRFKIISEEKNDFLRVIDIDPDATFKDLRECVLASVGYKDDNNDSFFICDDNWQREKEISVTGRSSLSDQDDYRMDDTILSELLEDEGDKLSFRFDEVSDREFFMELKEVIFGQSLDTPDCVRSSGKAPIQIMPVEEPAPDTSHKAKQPVSDELDLEFYGDEGYNDDEISDGFDFGDEESSD